MKKHIIYILLLCFQSTLYAQTDSATIKKVDQLFDDYLDVLYNAPDSTIIYLDSIELISKKGNYEQGIALSLRERGLYFSDKGDYVKAMELISSALVIDEKIDNKDGVASDLLFIGAGFSDQGKAETALDYLLRARDIYIEMDDQDGVALLNHNLGGVYNHLGLFEKALEHHKSSYHYYLENGYEAKKGSAENNIGNVYKYMEQYDLALEYFFRSIDSRIKCNKTNGIAITFANIGDVYLQQEQTEEAIEYYEQAMEYANKHSSILLQKDLFLDFSKAYEKLGDEKKALDYFKEYNNLKDTLLSDDFNNDLANMKVKYDTDRKEKENLILIKDNELKEANIQKERSRKVLFASLTGIVFLAALFIFIQFRNKKKLNIQLEQINKKVNKQNATLKILNKELIDSEENLTISNESKNQLISMLSHDLLNPVTAIANYTNQVSDNLESMSKSELEAAFNRVKSGVVPLQDLLSNILQWAQFQNKKISPSIESINLYKVITKIIDLYQPGASFKDVEITSNTRKDLIINTDRLMLFFIVRNIVNNAVKFCNKSTTINIEVSTNEKETILCIKDEGKGFDKAILTALNAPLQQGELITTNGTGIGLSTSRQFIELLKGSISFENTEKGASVTLLLPKS